jgi:uncharacterized protein (DUF58 family)
MASWIRRSFTSTGLTQIPPGPYLKEVQNRFGGGTVVLMIDVSGSMHGTPILEAVRGAKQFVAEAIEAQYHVGVMLWNTGVVALSQPAPDSEAALRILNPLNSAGGGNFLIGPLETCHQILDRFTGDRVVALFGDGDLTPKPEVLRKVAQMKAENIRFVTRGLGNQAAQEFGEISDEDPTTASVENVSELAAGIASMATSLRSHTGLASRRSAP